ncbi:MAG: Ldh family oxidoreductase [Alphaproteobacteria bacterium]
MVKISGTGGSTGTAGVTRSVPELEDLAARGLERAGTRSDAARSVARALVKANADGLASHGLARLPTYCAQVRAGKVDGGAVPTGSRLGASGARIDAGSGFAFPALDLAIEMAAEMARETPVVALAVTNSHHFGIAGHHVERLAERGLVGLIFGNSPAGIAPWGGARPLFGTNPIAFACPLPDLPPLVVDVSLSKQARGKVMIAAREGRPIPEGWAIDSGGRPTTDPEAALAGSMLPMGDAKGAALALAVEVLSAALTGANFGYEASSFFDDKGGPPRVGQFMLALAPEPFSDGTFLDRVGRLVDAILAEPNTRLPGSRRLAARAKSEAEGIELPAGLHSELQAAAGG